MASKVTKAEPDASHPNSIEIRLADMEMRPPNLQVEVKRIHDPIIHPEVGKILEEQIITFEGTGLISDKQLIIVTRWFDHDGKPLPESLPGYTAKITKVVKVNTLANDGTDVKVFPVSPNQHTQILRFPVTEQAVKFHFYVQFSGEDLKGGNPDFSTLGAGVGALELRPAKYAPVLVQILDKYATDIKKVEVKALVASGITGAIQAYEPEFGLFYRPEMQYTLINFDPVNIKPKNPLPTSTQVISLMADSAQIQQLTDGYSVIIGPQLSNVDLNPLTSFDSGGREFSLQLNNDLGEVIPVTISIDQAGATTISDPGGLLTVADYLTILSLIHI